MRKSVVVLKSYCDCVEELSNLYDEGFYDNIDMLTLTGYNSYFTDEYVTPKISDLTNVKFDSYYIPYPETINNYDFLDILDFLWRKHNINNFPSKHFNNMDEDETGNQ
jgi:hypothetical protein